MIAVAVVSPFFYPPDYPQMINLPDQLLPPTAAHPFGTDDYGRDMLGLIMLGANLDLRTSFIIVGISLVIGIALGAAAGYIGGRIDEVVMRVTDIFLAFPALILAMAVAAVLGRSLENLILALIVVWWPPYTRLMRGQILSERHKIYVEALIALGIKRRRIIVNHVIPNTIYPILVQATLDIGTVILVLAGLSFIGFGPGAQSPEWGWLVYRGEQYMFTAPHVMVFSGLAILITALSFNLLGDGLRDILDPRLRR